ncbi:type II toxin-antitoxin system VapC family toxin [Candidatus Pacearchaeota archaeon]|nr:type II toxin-antitoxin system VapC family toxin [Candidatus Pacearchaeota archaeon]
MLVDANIFLEFLLNQERAKEAVIFLNKILIGNISAYISSFTIDSIILTLYRNKIKIEDMRIFLKKLLRSKGFDIYQLTMKDRFLAFHHLEEYGLDYEDAITLQCALSAGCKEIVSFDSDFDKVKEIKRIEP